jgi:tRNA(Ile)-lysidine synthase
MYHGPVSKLPQSVLVYIRQHQLLRAGDRVGVAVSGGADSVALLRILVALEHELGIVLSVIHLNHKLRASESDADEAFVRQLTLAHGLEFRSESADVQAHAARQKLSLESAARQLRYGFFEKLLKGGSLDKAATGHTIDDQAETVLLKLARGAGTRGLAGIYPQLGLKHQSVEHSPGSNQIVRPLLGVRRAELEAYLRDLPQNWREDSSNRDLRHTRNRIRHEILPNLEKQVNPAVRDALADFAEIARAEEEFWAGQMATLLPRVWKKNPAAGELDWDRMIDMSLALQRRLVRGAGESLGLHLEFRHVEEVLALPRGRARGSLPQNWSASWHQGKIRFEPGSRQSEAYAYLLSVPGRVQVLEAGIEIEAFLVAACEGGYNRMQLLAPSCVERGLTIRNWRAGDRFWPAHTREPKKIKELLQDRHITGPEKRLWPVVTSGDEVVWLRGFGVRRDFQSQEREGVLIRDIAQEAESPE